MLFHTDCFRSNSAIVMTSYGNESAPHISSRFEEPLKLLMCPGTKSSVPKVICPEASCAGALRLSFSAFVTFNYVEQFISTGKEDRGRSNQWPVPCFLSSQWNGIT